MRPSGVGTDNADINYNNQQFREQIMDAHLPRPNLATRTHFAHAQRTLWQPVVHRQRLPHKACCQCQPVTYPVSVSMNYTKYEHFRCFENIFGWYVGP